MKPEKVERDIGDHEWGHQLQPKEGKVDASRNGHHASEEEAEVEGGAAIRAAAEEAEHKRKNARMLLQSGEGQSSYIP